MRQLDLFRAPRPSLWYWWMVELWQTRIEHWGADVAREHVMRALREVDTDDPHLHGLMLLNAWIVTRLLRS